MENSIIFNNKNDQTILSKWIHLQKIIKQEITLEEIISSQEQSNLKTLQSKFLQYYQNKMKTLQTFENIFAIDKNSLENIQSYEINEFPEKVLLDAYDPIFNFFFILRSNYNYILSLVSIIEESENLNLISKELNSFVDLLNHRFYDNILIPNPEEEELLTLIYLLLEREINEMNSASSSSFLDERYCFLGKFLKSYTKKQELKSYLSLTLGNLIMKIENSGDKCLDLNLMKIKMFLENEKKKNNNDFNYNNFNNVNLEEYLTKDLPKCNIHFHDKENVNNINYSVHLTQIELSNRIQTEKNPDLKEFYLSQLERINKDPDVFTNKKFLQSLQDENNKFEIVKFYKNNFKIIINYINNIIQSLIDKIKTIPYPIRCICKIIYILISNKFSKISKYERNSFIGEFIFGKCILNILVNSDINAVITSTILSHNTRNCLVLIAKVLTKINRGLLFEANLETDSTIFNHYIIEVIPIINKFYDDLIDVQLPSNIEKMIEDYKNKPKISPVKQIHLKPKRGERKKEANDDDDDNNNNNNDNNNNNNNNNNNDNNNNNNNDNNNINNENNNNEKKQIKYSYFNENPDELINIQCICFSIEDVLFLSKMAKSKIERFSHFSRFNFFSKTVNRILNEEYKLEEILSHKSKKKTFFLLFKTEKSFLIKNPISEGKKINNNMMQILENEDDKIILEKIKFCLKIILKGLNIISTKNYPYFIITTNNNNFFSAIKLTLNEIDDFMENVNVNKIPLKWYSEYIFNNKNSLNKKYIENDYELLFQEFLNEEEKILNDLKNFSSLSLMNIGLNLRCAEKLIEKANSEMIKMIIVERFMKAEKFVQKNEIKICFDINKSNIKNVDNNNIDDENGIETIKICLQKNCRHNNNNFSPNINNNNNIKNEYHCRTIKDFYLKFINDWKNNIEKFPNFNSLIKHDISTGIQSNKIYKTFENYMNIVKMQLENENKKKTNNNNNNNSNNNNNNNNTNKNNINNNNNNNNINNNNNNNENNNNNNNNNNNDINNKNLKQISEEINFVCENIEDYIIKKIYPSVFPPEPLEIDRNFYNQTRKLQWILPIQLEIKNIYKNQLNSAKFFIKKMDEEKSVNEKLNCISKAYNTINNTIKFCSGENSNAGADDLSPIFQYIIIQAQPERFFSNIYYIKCFLNPDKLKGMKGYLLTQMQFAAEYIMKIDHVRLGMNKEEFDEMVNKTLNNNNNNNNE